MAGVGRNSDNSWVTVTQELSGGELGSARQEAEEVVAVAELFGRVEADLAGEFEGAGEVGWLSEVAESGVVDERVFEFECGSAGAGAFGNSAFGELAGLVPAAGAEGDAGGGSGELGADLLIVGGGVERFGSGEIAELCFGSGRAGAGFQLQQDGLGERIIAVRLAGEAEGSGAVALLPDGEGSLVPDGGGVYGFHYAVGIGGECAFGFGEEFTSTAEVAEPARGGGGLDDGAMVSGLPREGERPFIETEGLAEIAIGGGIGEALQGHGLDGFVASASRE